MSCCLPASIAWAPGPGKQCMAQRICLCCTHAPSPYPAAAVLWACSWRQYRFHVEEGDNEVVVSVALEGNSSKGGIDLFLKSEQPAGALGAAGVGVQAFLCCCLHGGQATTAAYGLS